MSHRRARCNKSASRADTFSPSETRTLVLILHGLNFIERDLGAEPPLGSKSPPVSAKLTLDAMACSGAETIEQLLEHANDYSNNNFPSPSDDCT
jgi:hypothetical protein